MTDIQLLSRFQGMVHTFDLGMGAKPDRDLRIKLIQEEAEELISAIKTHDVVETIDAICDLLYVSYGAAHVLKVGALALQDDPHENQSIAINTPDWVKLNYNLEPFGHAVNMTVLAIRAGSKDQIRAELKDLVEGLWSAGAKGVGVDLKPFFEEVHRTNMHKLQGPKREDGKQLKPEGWKPPRIEAMYQRLRSGKNPHCDVTAPIHAKEHSFDIAERIEHPDGGYHCRRCGGLFVSWELNFGEDYRRGKAILNEPTTDR